MKMQTFIVILFTAILGCVGAHAKTSKKDLREDLLEKAKHLTSEQIKALAEQRIARLEETIKMSKNADEIAAAKERLKRIKGKKLSAKDIKHELQKDLPDDERAALRQGKIERLQAQLKKAKSKEKIELEEKIEKLKGKIGDEE